MDNMKASEVAAVVGEIDPDAYATGTYTSGWINAADFDRYMATVEAGDLGTSATLDAKLEQAQDGSGTGAKDISGTDITQLTEAGGDSNKQAVINLNPAGDMDTANEFTHFRLSMTVGTAASDASGVVHGIGPVYGPASDHDASTVAEVVN